MKAIDLRSDTVTKPSPGMRRAMAEGGSAKVVKDGLISHDSAEGQIPPDLSSVGENQRIKEIRHCRDAYYVTTADGAEFPFWETNVRIKTDTSARGPQKASRCCCALAWRATALLSCFQAWPRSACLSPRNAEHLQNSTNGDNDRCCDRS